MKHYQVIILSRAEKEMRKLFPKDQKRILSAIEALEMNPFMGKQLQGDFDGAWAIRVWPYRIIYVIEKRIVTVKVLRIGHRKDVYR